jgi:hypothetical protein
MADERQTKTSPPNHLDRCLMKSMMLNGDCSYMKASIQENCGVKYQGREKTETIEVRYGVYDAGALNHELGTNRAIALPSRPRMA